MRPTADRRRGHHAATGPCEQVRAAPRRSSRSDRRRRTARCGRALLTIVALAGILPVVVSTGSGPASALPTGFVEQTVLGGLVQPMSVRFSPDGRVFIAEKSGLIKVFDSFGDPSPSVVADLRTQVYNHHDRGLMSIELAPDFPVDPTLYALYARDAEVGGVAPRWGVPGGTADPCPNPPGAGIDGCVNSGRLSRFTLTGSVAGPEQVMIDDWCAQFASHSVGDLAFGPDGYLYASGGDGASYTFADYGQTGSPLNPCGDPPAGVGGTMTVPTAEGGALRSQDVQTPADPQGLDGTMIRIDPTTAEGAPGNPYATSSDRNRRRIIAAGMRNPFRFTFRPGSGEIWLGDVGYTRWEEIDRIVSPVDGVAENFGWPCNEGNGRTTAYDIGLARCNAVYSGSVATVGPHHTYNHSSPVVAGDGCATAGSAVSGIAFYPGGTYPDSYDGALFFADYSRRCIWTMFPGADGTPDPSTLALFRPADAFAVDLQIGPNNDLFYVDIAAGALRRIRYDSGAQAPTAAIQAAPSQGALPLAVILSAGASTDPQGSALTYAWDTDGNGQFDNGTDATVIGLYLTSGIHHPAVRVTNAAGLSDVASTPVTVGSRPPVPTIAAPAATATWKVGDQIAFSGSATDPEDGVLPASRLSWQVVLEHCTTVDACHDHVITTMEGVASGTVDAPDHDYPAALELRLTATDSSGVAASTSVRLAPQVVDVTVQTDPPGLQATLDSTSGPTPLTDRAIVGSRLTLSTPATQTMGGSTYTFAGWSDGGARVHDVFVPAGAPVYRATFTRVTSSDPALAAAYSFDEGTGTRLIDRSGQGNDGTISGATWTGGRNGGALAFDGTSNRVTVADAPELDLTTGLTVEAWVRPTTTTGWRTVAMKERSGGLSYALYTSGEGPQPSAFGSIGGDRSVVGPSALPINTWSHLATTYDGATMRLYVDGTQVASRPQTGALATSTSPLSLGGNGVWGEHFSGTMDDVRIYRRALTAAEIGIDRNTPVTTDTSAPSAPGSLTATGGPGTVALRWAASTDDVGVTSYAVHRSTTSGFVPAAANQVATVTTPSFDDSGLAPGTHHYRVVARDGSGNASAPSAQASALVTGDVTAPAVAISAPTAGATVAGTVSVTASATDAGGVAGVQFRVDGVALGTEDTVAPYTVGWNTATVANGSHQLTAVARDHAGNTATAPAVSVTVANDSVAPAVALTAPAAGATVSGTVNLAADATDAGGIAGVQFRLDGAPLGTEDTTAPYGTAWNTAAAANGAHTLTAVARDRSGNATTSAPVAVTVANTSASGLVAAYSFDEGAGTTLLDRSGRGHPGTVTGATWGTGRTGGGLTFNGTTAAVTIADHADLDLGAMTIEAWVRPTTVSGWRTVVLKERPAGLAYGLYASGDSPGPSGWTTSGTTERRVQGPSALPVGTWSHLAVTHDLVTMRLFVDGVQVASVPAAGASTTSTGPLRLGGNAVWGEYFAGTLDDVRLYDRALTAAEIVVDRDRPVTGASTATTAAGTEPTDLDPLTALSGPAPDRGASDVLPPGPEIVGVLPRPRPHVVG